MTSRIPASVLIPSHIKRSPHKELFVQNQLNDSSQLSLTVPVNLLFNMTWSAFLVAMRNGIQTRANAARQGANRAAQQTQRPGANQARAASTKANEKVGNAAEFDFLVMEEVSFRR